MAKSKSPPSAVYSLAQLARAWGCDLDQLELMAAAGELTMELHGGLNGRLIPFVTDAERLRCEEAKRPQGRYVSQERDSHLLLIGALSVAYCGGDPNFLESPYTLAGEITTCAAANGAPMARSDDTNAKILRESIALLTKHGFKMRRAA